EPHKSRPDLTWAGYKPSRFNTSSSTTPSSSAAVHKGLGAATSDASSKWTGRSEQVALPVGAGAFSRSAQGIALIQSLDGAIALLELFRTQPGFSGISGLINHMQRLKDHVNEA